MEENEKSGLLGKAMHVGERLMEVGGEATRLANRLPSVTASSTA